MLQASLKKIIAAFLLVFPSILPAQDITGLWKGVIYNDTTQQNLRYEVGISEEKGKLTGFSHTFFIIDGKSYFGLKKIKIKKVNGKYAIEDAGLIADNYPERPPKGVHQVSALNFSELDGVMYLDGLFTTTRTKDFHPLTGSIHLSRKSDFKQSALIPHLTELGLADQLSFVKAANEAEALAVAKETAPVQNSIVEETPKVKSKVSIENVGIANKTAANKSKIDAKKNPVTIKMPDIILPPAAEVGIRKTETVETVYYKTDSLLLTLYDNGEVDGDTVSVLLDGKLLMPNVGLSTNPVTKTLYTDNTADSITLLMYAENLGSIPPNTGLLVVQDGDQRYEIRFSADMKKNSAIVFRRKRRE